MRSVYTRVQENMSLWRKVLKNYNNVYGNWRFCSSTKRSLLTFNICFALSVAVLEDKRIRIEIGLNSDEDELVVL